MLKIILIVGAAIIIIGIIIIAILGIVGVIDDIIGAIIILLFVVGITAPIIQGAVIEPRLANSDYWFEEKNTKETQLYYESIEFFTKKENSNYILEYYNNTYYFYGDKNCELKESYKTNFENCSVIFKKSDRFKLITETTKKDTTITHIFNKDFPLLFNSDEEVINDIKSSKKIAFVFNHLNSGTTDRYPEIADRETSINETTVTFLVPENTYIKIRDENGIYVYKKAIKTGKVTVTRTTEE